MSTEIAAAPSQAIAHAAMTPEQLGLIKRTICKPKDREATDDELALFQYQCERTGLDPFSRQIYAIFRWDGRLKQEKMTIQSSIDGFRLIAERTGKYIGQDGPYWCDAAGNWTEIWTDQAAPLAAKVVVKKLMGGVVGETAAVAHFSEYVATGKNGQASGQWGSMPALMIAKCAEALALRKAFPAETSGLYTAEEMAQADIKQPQVVAAAEPPKPPSARAFPEQLDELKMLVEGNGCVGDDLMSLMNWARETLTSRAARTAIEGLKTTDDAKRSDFVLRLETAAQKWQSEQQSDLPKPDDKGLNDKPGDDDVPFTTEEKEQAQDE